MPGLVAVAKSTEWWLLTPEIRGSTPENSKRFTNLCVKIKKMRPEWLRQFKKVIRLRIEPGMIEWKALKFLFCCFTITEVP